MNNMTKSISPQKVIRSKDFARRLDTACDTHAHVPPYNFGRLTTIRDALMTNYKIKVSNETVRKWFSGEARPRPDKMKMLAEYLGVDEAWLSLGISPDMTPRERKVRNAVVDGAVNVVAGFIQMNGGHPAFPEEGDPRRERVDIYAIIKGSQHSIKVCLANEVDGGYRFVVPREYADLVIIGVIQTQALHCEFLRIDAEVVEEHGVARGAHLEVLATKSGADYTVGKHKLARLRSFSDRLA